MPTQYTVEQNLPYPEPAMPADIALYLQNLAEAVNKRLITVCTSATRPTGSKAYAGHVIYETDTDLLRYYTGSAWRIFAGGDTGWIAPVFTNGWVNFDAAQYNAAGYRRQGTRIYLRGLVKSGTNDIFTLPAGFRPTRTCIFTAVSNNAFGRIDVTPAGAVGLVSGSNLFASLDGISFDQE